MTSKRVLVAIAAVVALAIAARFACTRQSNEEKAPQKEDSLEPIEHEDESGDDDPPIVAPKEEAAAKPVKHRVHVTGVVVEGGAPASGAIIDARGDNTDARARTTSGDDGHFELDIDARYTVRLDAAKGTNRRGTLAVVLGEQSPKDLRIELLRAAQVIVHVTNAKDHQPVQNARVQCAAASPAGDRSYLEQSYGPIETDAGGNAAMMIIVGGKYELEAEHDELGVAVVIETLDMRDEPQTIDIELRGSSALIGHVIDEQRAPIAGAELMLAPAKARQFGFRRAISDHRGAFRIGGVDLGSYKLGATSKDHARAELAIEKKDELNDLTVEVMMKTGGTIEGHVLDSHDAPLEGFGVFAIAAEAQERENPHNTRSKKDGSFVISALQEGEYILALARPDERFPMAFFAGRDDRVSARTGDKDVVLYADDGATIEGEVLFEGADPPPAYTVEIEDTRKQQPGSSPHFRLTNLAPGMQQVIVEAPGFTSAQQTLTLEEGATAHASFTLRAEQRASGRVIDRDSGEAVPRVMVIVAVATAQGPQTKFPINSATTDQAGEFTLRALDEGPLTLMTTAEGYLSTSAGPFSVGPGAPPIVIRVVRGVAVSGRVHIGDIPKRAVVTLYDRDKGWLGRRHTQTDDDGLFTIDGVAPGKHGLEVGDFEEGHMKNFEIDVPAGGLRDVDVDFGEAGARLVVDLPTAHAECRMQLFDATTRAAVQARAARRDTNQVVFTGLHPGAFRLSVACFDTRAATEEPPLELDVVISANETETHLTVPAR